jgi:hypothetical protein
MQDHKTITKNLKKNIETLKNTNQKKKSEKKQAITSFDEAKNNALVKELKHDISVLRKSLVNNAKLMSEEDENLQKFSRLIVLIEELEEKIKNFELEKGIKIVEEMESIDIKKIQSIKFKHTIDFPQEIRENVEADISELEKTFNSGCYRSSIIMCGRLLETALHRKLYEKTGYDLLEVHPEIGLGKIIAKLQELNVELPPGLTQQIHLINQARIYSVHKKKETFLPSKEQAYATILYTIDVLKKLF